MSKPMLSEKILVEIIRKKYTARLLEVMGEVDVIDDQGNVLLSKDLKVRHKSSQYEYTVDDVFNDPQTDDIMIALRLPDEPRFDPPPEDEGVIQDTMAKGKLEEDSLISDDEYVTDEAVPPAGHESDDVIFIVNKDEFERDYEVK